MNGNMMNPKPGTGASSASKPNDAFAIPVAAWPSESVVTEILLSLITDRPPAQPARVTPSTAAKTDYFKLIVSVATNVWRAENEVLDPNTGQIRAGMENLAARIDAIYQNLGEFGIVIHHHTGETYDESQSLNVLETIPTPGLDKTVILETVLPSISWNDRLIQNGEVKIATPLPSNAPVSPS
jgi:hypothetical protein